MIFRINRLIAQIRRRKEIGIGFLSLVLITSVIGNAITYYVFDQGLSNPAFGDALWYSFTSITTIGYGDFHADSLGARIGTAVFIGFLGLATFTTAIGIGVDWLLDIQFKERMGMGRALTKNHLLIINYPNDRRIRQVVDEYLQDDDHAGDEIVLVTDQIESLPPLLDKKIQLVKGSPIEEETYSRAEVASARQAIVLSTGYDDPHSDSINASIISILEHLNPDLRCVAECLNVKHSLLFNGSKNTSLVHTHQISSNLLVQEAQDPGVNKLTVAITSNAIKGTLVSTLVDSTPGQTISLQDTAKLLLDHGINLVGVLRGEDIHVQFSTLKLTQNDVLIYIGEARQDWSTLNSYLQNS
ncbi:MAG: ion channel [Chloroflexota bacterium]|jgi:voltage-gated potassium channel|nr:ion channel [Chloroflexota bacterium]